MKYSKYHYNNYTIILHRYKHRFVLFAPIMRSSSLKSNTGQYIVDVCCMTCIEIENNCKITISVRA